MNINDFKKKTDTELSVLAKEYRARLGQLRFGAASDRTKHVTEIRKIRRDIARVETIRKEKNR
ncbi:MAG: 50S ribosomal protein L29 [bacterium]|nr:50S ribosomal protein L29 [bacterium]